LNPDVAYDVATRSAHRELHLPAVTRVTTTEAQGRQRSSVVASFSSVTHRLPWPRPADRCRVPPQVLRIVAPHRDGAAGPAGCHARLRRHRPRPQRVPETAMRGHDSGSRRGIAHKRLSLSVDDAFARVHVPRRGERTSTDLPFCIVPIAATSTVRRTTAKARNRGPCGHSSPCPMALVHDVLGPSPSGRP